MSFNPQTGLVYIPTIDLPFIYIPVPNYVYRDGYDNMYAIQIPAPVPPAYKPLADKWPAAEFEVLKAWNPVNQKEVWRVAVKGTQAGGVLSTDGNLVFQGATTGSFYVYRADNGEKLKEIYTGTGIVAAPITYEIDDEQYIAVMAGMGGAILPFPDAPDAISKYKNEGRILVFKLNGKETPLPPGRVRDSIVPEPPAMILDKQMLAKGETIYQSLCFACHFNTGSKHFSDYPDLSMLSKSTHESFNDILLKGKLSFYGMANFSDVLKPEDVDAVHQYLISLQKERFEKQNAKK